MKVKAKVCKKCGTRKLMAEFYPSSRSEGYIARCGQCCREQNKSWRARNRIGKVDKRFKKVKTEKVCRGCHILKPISDFSPNHRKNGSSACKKCQVIRSREWGAKNPEKRFAARKAYNDSPAGKLSSRLCAERYNKKHPERRRVIHVVEMALKKKALERKPCKICGAFPVQAHHSDYSKPLLVTWLCRKHHTELHTEQNRKKLLC